MPNSGDLHMIPTKASDSMRVASVLAELRAVREECSAANWDGYDAFPVTEKTFAQSCRFVEALPPDSPMPDVGAEPDGAITLEWHHDPQRTLSISVHEDGGLHYAALIGPARHWGTEPFTGAVSSRILDLIHEVGSDA